MEKTFLFAQKPSKSKSLPTIIQNSRSVSKSPLTAARAVILEGRSATRASVVSSVGASPCADPGAPRCGWVHGNYSVYNRQPIAKANMAGPIPPIAYLHSVLLNYMQACTVCVRPVQNANVRKQKSDDVTGGGGSVDDLLMIRRRMI